MPTNKKKKGKGGAKKNKNKGRQVEQQYHQQDDDQGQSSYEGSSAAPPHNAYAGDYSQRFGLPHPGGYDGVSSSRATSGESSYDNYYNSKIYSKYKEATKRFQESIFSKIPPTMGKRTVYDLMDAVDFVVENFTSSSWGFAEVQTLTSDLRLALRGRKEAQQHYADEESGHSHFIAALNYCRVRLKQVPQNLKREHAEKAEDYEKEQKEDTSNDSVASTTNKFSSLFVDGDDGSESFDDDEDKHLSLNRPVVPTDLLINDIPDEKLDLFFFFCNLDALMGSNAQLYASLKKNMRSNASEGNDVDLGSSTLFALLEATVASNMSIQLVASWEQQLMADYPHLTTIYRMVAVHTLWGIIYKVHNYVKEHSPKASEFRRNDAIAFVGDSLEASFRLQDYVSDLPRRFATRWKISKEWASGYFKVLCAIKILETPRKQDKEAPSPDDYSEYDFAQQLIPELGGGQTYQWFQDYRYIGGNRSIVATIRNLQLNGCAYAQMPPEHTIITIKSGHYGDRWDDNSNVATKIQDDMDQALMGDLLPPLLETCESGMLSKINVYERELLTLFTEYRSFVRNPTMPVSWSIAFAIHLMLTSMFEVQGDGDIIRLGNMARLAFERFHQQVSGMLHSVARQENNIPPHIYPQWYIEDLQLMARLSENDLARAELHPSCPAES